jgi:hypothetical protein
LIYRLAIAVLLVGALPLAAQNSSLHGTVTDAHGATVPGAVIKVLNDDTSSTRATLSADSGAYEIPQVPPGKYKVTVEKPGFRTHSTDVLLQTNTPLTLDVKLEVGAVTETINVSAEAAIVNTENASVGNPFTEQQVKEIPLQTRNIVALLGVQPGVASTGQVAGARPDQNNVLLDGVDVNDNAGANGFNAVIPVPLDSVQEFRTTVAGLGADQGSYAGGQVSIITKSGSNQFHGTAYEYNRNTDTTANSWFSNRAGVARAALVRNQYGFSLGGPIINDNKGANGFTAVIPIPLDSVQEFRTTVAGLGADQGSYAGGQVSVVTKSGSNQFHGTAYEYNRNTFTSANDWFSNRAGVARAALVRNQYGFSVGGPILKNRLFFFYNWEARKDRSATAENRTVPSDTFKQGDILVLLKDGRTVTLTPTDILNIDPLHLGESSYIKSYMNLYPSGNNPLGSADKGLNTNSLLFNAPNHLDNHAQVGKLDYNLDPAGKHTFSLRGTLNGSGQDGSLAQFPGQAAVSRTLDNSRGLAGRYTAILAPHLVNVFNYGYTRLGTASTGNNTVIPSLYFTAPIATPRAAQRVAPTTNITDDMTWTKGRHTITFGVNFHASENDNLSFGNEPSYSFSKNTLLGLGGDIATDVTNYLAPTYGANIALSSSTNVANAFGALFGMLNNFGATYHYNSKGVAIPFGSPTTTAFEAHEYEGYVQDVFKFKRNITITAGLRYSIFGVPYEINGLQVVPQTNLNQFFADRAYAAANGISNATLSTSLLSYTLGGPVNHGAGFYATDKNDWAPRLALAYSPDSGTLVEKIMGKGSVFRAGAGIVYDHYGTAMAQSFAANGSPGLATTVAQPVNTNYTTAFRYTGNGFPTLPTVAGGSFPLVPATITGGFTNFAGVSTTLKAPYEYLINANYARPLPKKLSIELGYIGRLGHRQITDQDYGQPLTNFKDPVSGQTFAQAGAVLANLYNTGVTPAMVKANPSLIPNEPFYDNMIPALKNNYITGSASANFFYDVYNVYAGSWLDAMNDVDRVRQTNGTCLVRTGCNTFFPLQNSGLNTFTNAGYSNYNAATIVIRRAVSNGWGFDFNYTLGHALDNGSSSETSGGTALQDSFNPRAFYGPADFDSRHTITADAVIDVPVGKGKFLLGNAPKWLDYAIGGWQTTTLISFRTGTPLTVSGGGVYNVNYDNSAFGVLAPGATLPANGFTFDNNGIPSLFSNTNAVNSFVASDPGVVGTRGILRGLAVFNTDLAVSKTFRLPWEGIRVSLRGEAFNVLNAVNFGSPGLTISSPTTFGEITGDASGTAARVMQFALRLEF